MSGSFTFKLDSSTFEGGMRDLARITGKDFKEVVHQEGHAILKKAIKKTRAASSANIKAHYTYKGEGLTPASVIANVRVNGQKTFVRSIRKRGKLVTQKKGIKWDPKAINPQFKELDKVLKARLKWAKDRRGQSKATWVYIGKRAKLKPLTAPGYVMKALELMPQSLKRQLRGKDVGMSSSVYYLLIGNAGSNCQWPRHRKRVRADTLHSRMLTTDALHISK